MPAGVPRWTTYPPIINTLRRGSAVTTRSRRGDWYGVTFTVDGRVWGTDAAPAYMHDSVLSCR